MFQNPKPCRKIFDFLVAKVVRLFAILFMLVASGCFEYRFSHSNLREDVYFGKVSSRKKLDPKLGPSGKLYMIRHGWIRPYLSGDFYRRKHLSPIIGVIMYLNESSAIEIGYRRSIWENDWRVKPDKDHDPWREPEDMFYIGGKIVF